MYIYIYVYVYNMNYGYFEQIWFWEKQIFHPQLLALLACQVWM